MRIGRPILAFLVALSLALPMAGAFAVANEEPIAAYDCCDHGSMPANYLMKEYQASAACTACFSVAALVAAGQSRQIESEALRVAWLHKSTNNYTLSSS
jgi:hypothetical protein